MKPWLCRFIGHRRTRVSVVGTGEDRRWYSDPDGTREACRRCRRVLPRETG